MKSARFNIVNTLAYMYPYKRMSARRSVQYVEVIPLLSLGTIIQNRHGYKKLRNVL